jgi:outer membrane protein OmpA-like peptidoglycan-associated protein
MLLRSHLTRQQALRYTCVYKAVIYFLRAIAGKKIILPLLIRFTITKATVMKISLPLPMAILSLLIMATHLKAQDKKPAKTADTVRTANVEVSVVNAKNQPRKGEQVLFISAKTKKVFSAYTNADGKLTTALPAGDDYTVTVKAINDTSKYGTLNVPPLAPGQFFKDALGVDIMYEPAKEFNLNGVKFDVAKATLRPESNGQLQDLLEYLQWKTDISIEIDGHTDNVGKAEDNLKLSQARAEAVKDWLVKKGIGAARITAKGFGDTQPVADNSTTEGRQKNRRTEIKIL